MGPRPTPFFERRLLAQGYRIIAGVDEAGRGPLAGPLVAAAAILPTNYRSPWLAQVRDSKMLSPTQREGLYAHVTKQARAVGIGIVEAEGIDQLGIVQATRIAMCQAIDALSPQPDFVLIDYLRLPQVPIPQQGLVKGDVYCLSIAAASIVAKVTRDRLLEELDHRFPGYGFARHKGYPTPGHLASLQKLGPSPVHRRSFAPVRRLHPGMHGL